MIVRGVKIPISLLITFFVSSTIFFGYYILFHPMKLQLLYQSWDGPLYVVVARSFYDPKLTELVNTVGLPNNYFANCFPLYPLFIKLFSFTGYWRASILVTQLFTLAFVIAIYNFIKKVYPKEKLNWIALPLIFFPARWFSITHIGSSEPLFLLLVTISLISLSKKAYFQSAVFLALAQITRHAAIWFFMGIAGYLLFAWLSKKLTFKKAFRIGAPYLLVPLALICVNLFFYSRYQDTSIWFANVQKASYFQLIPYHIFSLNSGVIWRESLVFDYLLYLGGVLILFKEKKYIFAFLLLFNVLPLIFLVQEDLSRIALSGLPLLYLAYHKIIANKTFQLALLLLVPAIYLYSFQFLNYNISP